MYSSKFSEKKILCICHHKNIDLGLIKYFFINKNYKIDILKPLHDLLLPKNVDSYSGIIILGGAMNVCDTKQYPGLKKELSWIKNLLNLRIPVLGICLGAQLIAKASGAEVNDHHKNLVEVGYKKINLESNEIYLKNFPKKLYQWHRQGISLPPSAKLLASNSFFKVQVYVIKNNIFGFQFHPEVIKDIILSWNSNSNSQYMHSRSGAASIELQLQDHIKYSNLVKIWFNNFLKDWLDLD